MFRELKEYQDIIKLYQNNVYQSEEDIIKEAFASEEFTEEEAAFIEENFDALIEEVIAEEEESLSEQVTGRQRGKMLRQKADEIISDIRKPAAKTTKVSSKAIQGGKTAGAVGKFKSALSKVGSKIGNVAKTAVKTGAAPFKAGGAVSKMGAAAGKSGLAVKGAKVLSKLGPAGKLAAGAALAGGALLANRKNIKAAADKAKGEKISKQVDKYVAKNKGDKPIRKIDPAPFNKREKAEPVKSATASEPVVSDKTKQGKPRTKAQMMAAKRIASGKTIADVKKDNTDAMKARAKERFADFKAKRAAKSGNAKPEAQAKPVEKPAATPSGDKLKAGSFGISEKGKKQAAANRAEVAKKNTVPSGSFGISEKGKKQAAANRAEKKAAMEEFTPYDLVLEYLLSSEQVATIEEANYVMTEMDEKTIQGIVEEQKKNLDEGLLKAAGYTALALPAIAAVAKKFLKPKTDKQIDKGRKTLDFGGDKRSGVTEEGIFKSNVLNKKYPNQPKMTEKGKKILPKLNDPTINGKDYNKKFGIGSSSQKALDMLNN